MGVFIWANDDQHRKLVETKELQRKVWGGGGGKKNLTMASVIIGLKIVFYV